MLLEAFAKFSMILQWQYLSARSLQVNYEKALSPVSALPVAVNKYGVFCSLHHIWTLTAVHLSNTAGDLTNCIDKYVELHYLVPQCSLTLGCLWLALSM